MKEKEIRIVERFKALASKRANVREVRVFGSRARGDASEGADLDVLVVLDSLDSSIERYISDCAWEAGFPEDVVVVPVAVTLDAIKKSPIRESSFIRTVLREGITV